ncbi:MAG: hypothetical protein WBA77_20675 [Microcoleaceae cyanobacterium]
MTFTTSKSFTLKEFIEQYGDNPYYELIDRGRRSSQAPDFTSGVPMTGNYVTPNRLAPMSLWLEQFLVIFLWKFFDLKNPG